MPPLMPPKPRRSPPSDASGPVMLSFTKLRAASACKSSISFLTSNFLPVRSFVNWSSMPLSALPTVTGRLAREVAMSKESAAANDRCF